MDEKNLTEDTPANVSRRNFIKGVVAAGATVSSASYLFRTTMVSGQQASAAGAVERLITLNVNGQNRPVDSRRRQAIERRQKEFHVIGRLFEVAVAGDDIQHDAPLTLVRPLWASSTLRRRP